MNPETNPTSSSQPDLIPAAPESPSSHETSAPSVGAHLRLHEKVKDALAQVSGGDQIDRYFGISGGVPEQSAAEAAEGDTLLEELKGVTQEGGDLSALLGRIVQHNESSGIDPDLLRALRQPRPRAE